MKFSAAVVLVVLSACASRAAPLIRDLGQGLLYFRMHELPADLPKMPAGHKGTSILDLRYAAGDDAAAAALDAWVRFNSSARNPVFILANRFTAAVLLRSLSRHDISGVLIIGADEPPFHPDIAVAVAPATEREAYDALEHGAAVASLLSDNPGKPRMDEAELAREHLPDQAVSEDVAAKKAASAPPPPLVDRVLQRAVQLDHGLIALKRLP